MRNVKYLMVLGYLMAMGGLAVLLSASSVMADNDTVIDQINVTVQESCTMSGVGMNSHNAELLNNEYSADTGSDYENGIGKTTMTVFCNDFNGFSIYAIGFTGDSYTSADHTKLVGTNDNTHTISTAVHSSGDTTSSWAMKVTKVTDGTVAYIPANMSIQNSFDVWHAVPANYTKVAQYHANSGSSATDTVLGGKIESTYAVYVSVSQLADTYTGQVKYTLVHPYDEQPLQPQPSTAGYINYYANASTAEGTMGRQSAADGNTVTLFASNFSREGYGFAGWSDAFDYATNANAHFYGPNEDITVPTGTTANGLALYAVWVRSAGDMQTDATSVCNNLTAATYSNEGDEDESTWSITASLNSISALTDTRDNQTYAIAKLSDGNCWMIENLRLADTHEESGSTVATTLTAANTNNPSLPLTNVYDTSSTSDHLSPTSSVAYDASTAPEGWCQADSAACDNQSRLRTDNTASRVSYTTTQTMSTGANLYSYGNYYNWYSATAGRGTYSKSSGVTDGDLCPTGWHLPYGGSGTGTKGGNTSGGFYYFANSMQATTGNAINSKKHRHFPNNVLYSGCVNGASLYSRGTHGYYWSSTAYNSTNAYYLSFYSSSVGPGTYYYSKYSGRTVRCLASSS